MSFLWDEGILGRRRSKYEQVVGGWGMRIEMKLTRVGRGRTHGWPFVGFGKGENSGRYGFAAIFG